MNEPFELRPRDVPPAVRWIVQTLEAQGFETWTVGGGVRDIALGRPPADWDLATLARPNEIQRTFKRTVPVGVDHGTVGVLKDGRMYEVTTFRKDIEPLGRRAIVKFADSLDEDLSRRDFTLNALAWHPTTGETRDPFNGSNDIQDRVLRAVGIPAERFREDYLRILRGLRFAGDFGFDIEPDTWAAITEAVEGLDTLSRERIREELMKVLSGTRRASATLALYGMSGALSVIMPELRATRTDPGVWAHTLTTIDGLSVADPVLRVAALMVQVAQSEGVPAVLAMLHRLRFSKAEAERIGGCVAPPWELPVSSTNGVEPRRWAASSKAEHRNSRLRLAMAQARAAQLHGGQSVEATVKAVRRIRGEMRSSHALGLRDLTVDGKDLIRLGLKPGPAMGDVLEALLEEVLVDPAFNERETLLGRAQEAVDRTRLEGDAS